MPAEALPTRKHEMERHPVHPKNVSVLLRSESSRVDLAAQLKPIQGIDFNLMPRPVEVTGPFGRGDKRPDVVLVEVDPTDASDIGYIRALKAGRALGNTPIVALTESAKQLAALSAIRAGADDVLLMPIVEEDLYEVFGRVVKDVAQPEDLGRLIAFVHVTGGAGATTLAVNSAALLAQSGGVDVCLLDLDIQYGNAANLLDINKVSPTTDLIDEPARLDRDMLESMLINHDCGVRVLTAPQLPFALGSYRSDMVAKLLQIAKRRYPYVIVDLPVAIAPWTDVVLREAAVIYLVCTPSVTAVHRLVQFLRLMDREGLGELPFRIVLNRHHDRGEGADISESKFAKAIGRQVAHRISNDYGLISMSHNQGRPAISLRPKSRFAQQLSQMLSEELGSSAMKPIERSWWKLGGR